MTWVKVCGLTEMDDVAAAVAAGADAVGFVNVPSSPRFITTERVRFLAADVPVHTVLLTYDVAPEGMLPLLEETGVSGLQPYGQDRTEAAQMAYEAGYVVLYPEPVKTGIDVSSLPGIPLLDTPSGTALGGTGRTFDWSVMDGVSDRFVLAGGLGPNNVAAAVAQVRPWGVDASSGLEQSPGKKDHGMVADFIAEAKKT